MLCIHVSANLRNHDVAENNVYVISRGWPRIGSIKDSLRENICRQVYLRDHTLAHVAIFYKEMRRTCEIQTEKKYMLASYFQQTNLQQQNFLMKCGKINFFC